MTLIQQPVRSIQRRSIVVRGAVQGVGFRPFVYRLAQTLQLTGWVENTSQGVTIDIEGDRSTLDEFQQRLQSQKPALASIRLVEFRILDPVGFHQFEIRNSTDRGAKTAVVLPDIATCPDCLREMLDSSDRRYRYPFINCTNCGPRFSIIESLPYDRPNTSMRRFTMCDACAREYHDPVDRRFHAQPVACPQCGPRLALWDPTGHTLAERHDALLSAAKVIRDGGIVALKGLGGFQLLADARHEYAVNLLRRRKHREEKPLAVMVPDIDGAVSLCHVSDAERQLLQSAQAPIVLLRARRAAYLSIAPGVAPRNPYLGIMLPYTPLHYLLMHELRFPIVATSGNLSDEPLCIDEREALTRLNGVADVFLVHDRPIVRHVDDSICRIIANRPMILRRARGYAPLPVEYEDAQIPLLAVGAHQKNTVALSHHGQIFISQHIGDLVTRQAFDAFQRAANDLPALYDASPQVVACDLHPEYLSTHYAQRRHTPIVAVQHHHAHIASCMVDNNLSGTVLGVAWDGTGYGADGTVWGGEFLRATIEDYDRVAHLATFPLPGGERVAKEPRRSALGLLYACFGDSMFDNRMWAVVNAFTAGERRVLRKMLAENLNCPATSSAGRLFDAVAALLGLWQRVRHGGQAAMELEFAAERGCTDDVYSFSLLEMPHSEMPESAIVLDSHTGAPWIVDLKPMISAILDDIHSGLETGSRSVAARRSNPHLVPCYFDPAAPWEESHLRNRNGGSHAAATSGNDHDPIGPDKVACIARKFHNTLGDIIVAVAQKCELERVVLSGGCFQNKLLTESTITKLTNAGFRPYWHRSVPPNDGGISLGQAAVAAQRIKEPLTCV